MDEDLHYKTGKMGRMARFFAARRASGDPYEETVVLPAMIVISALQLYDFHLITDWLLITVFLATNIGAGMWLGACLGLPGTVRVVLRSISVGAIEAALLTGLNDKLDRHQALFLALQLIGINLPLFWVGHIYVSSLREFTLISEAQWHKTAPSRRWIYSVYRISVGAEKLEGAPDGIVVAVILVRLILPPLAMAMILWTVFGINPLTYIRHLVPYQ